MHSNNKKCNSNLVSVKRNIVPSIVAKMGRRQLSSRSRESAVSKVSGASKQSDESIKTTESKEVSTSKEKNSQDTISPESSQESSRGSTPSVFKAGVDYEDKGKAKQVLEWWKNMSSSNDVQKKVKQENLINILATAETEVTEEEMLEQIQQLITEEWKIIYKDMSTENLDLLKKKLQEAEDNKIYEVRKCMQLRDKEYRFRALNGELMAETTKNIQKSMHDTQQQVFAVSWGNEAMDYSKGREQELQNRVNNDITRRVDVIKRMYRNTWHEMEISKQANLKLSENTIDSSINRSSLTCDRRLYYLDTVIRKYLHDRIEQHNKMVLEVMNKELRTMKREIDQLRRNVGLDPTTCCDVCIIL